MDTPLASAAIVVVSMLLSVVGLLLVRRFVPPDWLRRHHELAGYYFQIQGTIYAVLIAFAIYEAWVGFNDAASNLEHEATEIADLSRLSTAMPVENRRSITLALMEYLNAVVDDEFPAMAEGRDSERTWTAVTRVWDTYSSLPATDPRQQSYLNESLTHLTRLSDLRRTRLFTSHGTTPWILWILLTVSGVLLVGFSYLSDMKHHDARDYDRVPRGSHRVLYVPDTFARPALLGCREGYAALFPRGTESRGIANASLVPGQKIPSLTRATRQSLANRTSLGTRHPYPIRFSRGIL